MPVTTTATETFALWVSPTGTFRLLHWLTVTTPHQALCCDTAGPVCLTDEVTMWVDQDAVALGLPRNAPASELLRAYQPHPGLYFGDVVFTGATSASGDMVHGLTEDQALTLVDLYLLRITAHVPGQQRH